LDDGVGDTNGSVRVGDRTTPGTAALSCRRSATDRLGIGNTKVQWIGHVDCGQIAFRCIGARNAPAAPLHHSPQDRLE
jgi:hypothetical protein